jgi:predicted HicB family RNase H-like nuclease
VAQAEEPWVQLTTRIPKELHRRLRVYSVKHDIVLMRFVAAAIEEKLGRTRGSKKNTA